MRSLVTGANGFIGNVLYYELKLRGHEVVTHTRSANAIRNLQEEQKYDFSKKGIALREIDVFFHLAARVHVMHEQNKNFDPSQRFLEANLYQTIDLANAAAEAGIKRFVYVSTIKVNGECKTLKSFTEKDLVNPVDPYAFSKWQAEIALRKIERETGMEVVIVRPPLVYGPKVKANFLSLLKLVNNGVPLPFAAIGNERSLIYVGNLVDALIQCAVHPSAAGNTYLVSDGQDVSTPELIRRIADSLQTPARLLNVPLPLMSFIAKLMGKSSSVERLTQSLVIDSSKIRNELGWSPPYTLEQGLAATAAWFKENH